MLFSILPFPGVIPPIMPIKRPIPVLLIMVVLTNIFTAIFPGKGPLAMHLIVLPISYEISLIIPFIGPFSMDVIIKETSFIFRAVISIKHPMSMFFPVFKLPSIRRPIRPGLNSLPFLYIVNPTSFVSRTVGMDVYTLPLCSVV